ncbi:MAG: copper chaperone CopZ [Syntrophomonadaceae bacterium]|nr:copper chaperone CopZ [Syntrophomonadaceae bacterium]
MANNAVLNVEGMSCMHCVNTVKSSVGALPGVSKVEVDLSAKKVAVTYEGDKVNLEKIKAAIEDAGYEVQ